MSVSGSGSGSVLCVFICVSGVWACFTICGESENQELTILVRSHSFVAGKMLDPTSLNCWIRFPTVMVEVRLLHYVNYRSPQI